MRVLFHYTHKQTLGHTTRSISFVTALCRLKADVLVLQGGLVQPFVRFPSGCRVMDIPFPFDARTSFQAHAVPVSASRRAQFILKAAAEFCPDVFITEFFPFGRSSYLPELLPLLRYLRKKGTRIMASIGYPLIIDLERFSDPKFAALQKAVFAFYDNFLIHTPQELETPYIQKTIPSEPLARSYAALMKDLKARIDYTGYIFPEKIITGDSLRPNSTAPSIVVSRGGGAVYPKLMTTAIEAQRLLGGVHTVIACGPATTAAEKALFTSCLDPQDNGRVVLSDLLADLDDHLRTARVSVSLCGYNTCVQLMRYGTPSVIVPYHNTLASNPTNDQMARSRLLAERFSGIILDYDTMTPQSLSDAIKEQMSKPRPAPAPRDWFNGAETAARLVLEGRAN
ncbi:MAG: hypothetical protein KGJ95_02830 [Candidatus Omnitrophica bacterium]|nr:hypothetical protein [Candidatus Omnitrophota bacterium]